MNSSGVRDRTRAGVHWGRRMANRFLSFPVARRLVADLLRVEVLDRSLALAAQALLALLPLLVVAAAFLPDAVIAAGVERFRAVTGVGSAAAATLAEQGTSATPQVERARVQIGWIGALVTVFSASSFSRALQRAYERVWERPHVRGLAGRWRALVWLLGWLLGLEILALVGALVDGVGDGDDLVALEVLGFVVRVFMAALLWWWTMHFLLQDRVTWRTLAPAAALSGAGVVAFSAASSVVMPAYAASSMEQFGTLGLVLSVATWLVGFAGVLVVTAVVGRVLAEEPDVRILLHRLQRGRDRDAPRV